MMPIDSNNIKITSNYGNRQYMYRGKLIKDFHHGIDLIGGSNILAFEDGVVTSISNTGVQYGNACYVRIKHSNGYYTLYYHLKSGSVCVNIGDKVTKGQKIGVMGATGQATGVHLHFQIDKGNSASSINPYDYLFNDKPFIVENNNKNNDDLLDLVKRTIRGDYGNGQERKNFLGDRYEEVQHQVNENYNHGTINWDNVRLY